MRKYQQLLLIFASLISFSVLLMYKSENNRLKYVLQVVNFFGRNDAAVLSRLENATKDEAIHDFVTPLPVWQRISDNFYVYGSFWVERVGSASGNAISMVVGKKDAIINFKCSLLYKNGSEIHGSFLFMPVNFPNHNNSNEDKFAVFKFICQEKDIKTLLWNGPISLIFTDIKNNASEEIMLRSVKSTEIAKASKISMVACVNFVTYRLQSTNREFLRKKYLIQFFMHHKIIGIDNFLVYNSDFISAELKKILIKAGVHVQYLPFNFPFGSNHSKIREIIEMDCLMRTFDASRFVIFLEPNEFFYPSTNINFKDSVISSLSQYDKNYKFEIPAFSVCINHKNQLLLDNTLYDPDNKIKHSIYISEPTLEPQMRVKVALPLSRTLVHNYVNCISNKDLLIDWRNSIKEDFMQYLETIRNELSFLF